MKMKSCQDCSFDTIGISAPMGLISNWKFCPVCSGKLKDSNRYNPKDVYDETERKIPINSDDENQDMVEDELEKLRKKTSSEDS